MCASEMVQSKAKTPWDPRTEKLVKFPLTTMADQCRVRVEVSRAPGLSPSFLGKNRLAAAAKCAVGATLPVSHQTPSITAASLLSSARCYPAFSSFLCCSPRSLSWTRKKRREGIAPPPKATPWGDHFCPCPASNDALHWGPRMAEPGGEAGV